MPTLFLDASTKKPAVLAVASSLDPILINVRNSTSSVLPQGGHAASAEVHIKSKRCCPSCRHSMADEDMFVADPHRGTRPSQSSNRKQQEELKAAMKEALDTAGTLEPVRAHLRAVIFHALDGSSPDTRMKPPPSAEALVVHELFREYLAFAGLEHTLSVFEAEAGLAAAPVPRRLMAEQVGLGGAPSNIPLVFAMLSECARLNEDDQA